MFLMYQVPLKRKTKLFFFRQEISSICRSKSPWDFFKSVLLVMELPLKQTHVNNIFYVFYGVLKIHLSAPDLVLHLYPLLPLHVKKKLFLYWGFTQLFIPTGAIIFMGHYPDVSETWTATIHTGLLLQMYIWEQVAGVNVANWEEKSISHASVFHKKAERGVL